MQITCFQACQSPRNPTSSQQAQAACNKLLPQALRLRVRRQWRSPYNIYIYILNKHISAGPSSARACGNMLGLPPTSWAEQSGRLTFRQRSANIPSTLRQPSVNVASYPPPQGPAAVAEPLQYPLTFHFAGSGLSLSLLRLWAQSVGSSSLLLHLGAHFWRQFCRFLDQPAGSFKSNNC